jgi:spermidine synthase
MVKLLETRKQKFLFLAITTLGISSIVSQLFVMREFLNVFYGNELVFGIILSNWLLLTGIGSYLGKHSERIRNKIGLLIVFQILIALLPFLSIFLIRLLKITIMIPGEIANIITIFFSSLAILLPYCLISGFMLTLACSVFSEKRTEDQIGKVYFIDNIGDILGGIIFTFVLVYLFHSFQMAFFLLVLIIFSSLLLAYYVNYKKFFFTLTIILIASFIGFFSLDLNFLTTQMMFPGQRILHSESSPFGRIVITETSGQLNFFENGLPLFSTENRISNEETVHYAMIQSENPKHVLLISGGVSGTTNEILKYNVSRIDYVELDPLIIRLGKRFTRSLENPKIRTINTDGRLFVKFSKDKYEVVIIDLPDPESAQINRFYSKEFFSEVKRVLRRNGIVSLSLSSSANYMNPETIRLNSIVYNTLKSEFLNVIVIPAGEINFFIASDKPLSYEIAEMIEERGIKTKYVNRFYLKGKLTEERINYTINTIESETPSINYDFLPLAYYYHLLFWSSQFQTNVSPFIIIGVILIIIILLRITSIPFAIATTGFAASSLEVILLIGFQILYGYVYQYVGVIITCFMIGLGIGAYYMNKTLAKRKRKDMVKIEFLIFVFSLILPLILIFLSSFENMFLISLSSIFIFPLLMIIIASLVGMEFPLASKLHLRKKNIEHTAGVLYGSDLFGACVGALITSTLLIPIIGIINVCILTGILNLISGIIVWKR